jgi:hypothetical protein
MVPFRYAKRRGAREREKRKEREREEKKAREKRGDVIFPQPLIIFTYYNMIHEKRHPLL